MESKTVILRFRDLVTSENDTIEQHKAIIEEYGHVWWGWWNKGSEKVSDNLSVLRTNVDEEEPIDIFLVDSGQSILYRARCNGIKVYNRKKTSPDKDKTPAYYCNQSYYAWFRFIEFKRCEESILKNYSYIDCNQILIDKNTDYSRFENKRVYSIAELVQQNRSLWYVREAKSSDADNEIILLNADYIQPSNFSKKYYQSLGNTLLWLSDLHLTDNVFEDTVGKLKPTLAKHICDIVSGRKLAALLITGDITSRAEEEGFQIAKRLIRDINNEIRFRFSSENILICPGNHDFKRDENILQESDEPELIFKREESTEAFKEFYHSIYRINPNKYFASGKKILLGTGHVLEIVSLNSLMCQQYKNFDGHGYVSSEQLDYVAKEMGWDESANEMVIRIVMMHHHFLPSCYVETINVKRPSSIVYDADRLMEWVTKHHVRLLLHGHKHKSFFAQVGYPVKPLEREIRIDDLKNLYVVGMGGTGSKGTENKIATISFNYNEIVIEFFQLHSDMISSDGLCQRIVLRI